MEIRRRPPNPTVRVENLEYAVPHREAQAKMNLNFRRVIFCSGRKKTYQDVDMLVDDSYENLVAWKKHRGSESGFILMTAAHNKKYKVENRIYKLKELDNYLTK